MTNIKKLEKQLWESADLLRAGSKLTSNEYCMPVLGVSDKKWYGINPEWRQTSIVRLDIDVG